MADENNGKNGKVGLIDRVKEDVQAMKVDIPTKAKEQIEGLKDPTKTQVYTSIFRHKHDDTPRNRALGVLSNVFLHLHPAKINRDAVRYSYTWGMGGITFLLFIILTYTGVLLMFYYHPTKVQAFRDVLYLEHDVPFGKILRNMHRWAAHLIGRRLGTPLLLRIGLGRHRGANCFACPLEDAAAELHRQPHQARGLRRRAGDLRRRSRARHFAAHTPHRSRRTDGFRLIRPHRFAVSVSSRLSS